MDANGAEWMTVAEIAERFGVGGKTVRAWIDRGLLPAEWQVVPGAGGTPRVQMRVRHADVRAFGELHYRDKPRPAWLDEPDPPSPA